MSQPITVDEDELRAFNERAARQGHADRLATEETGTRGRYDRYQEEYHEFCKLVFKDDAERPPVTVDRAYNFLFYHAYRPLMPKQKKGEKYTCECGITIRRDGKSKHERTLKHQKFINQI